ncbi:hypothetical protein GJ744_009272 [Endocarpon pusillum]|uniref:Heterokaryon incompatibility domain-containing protein n=1 Tax=Endocarpon pusillum TaxID=364733 RepID=A0A8H7E2S9_9EURO|nr:hypothetical protein GJ744_009272 [Endocarpon pusillum]
MPPYYPHQPPGYCDPNRWPLNPSFPNQPPMGYAGELPMQSGYLNQYPTNMGYQNEHPMNMAYRNQVVANPNLGGHLTITNIPRLQPPSQRFGQPQVVANHNFGGQPTTTNIPRVPPPSLKPTQMERARSQDSAASCKACYDMNPRLQPKPTIPPPDPSAINIGLQKFLKASGVCPFCDLLLRIFQEYVDGAEEKVARAKRQSTSPFVEPNAKVIIKWGQPVVIKFSEGIHAKASVAWDDRVNGDKSADPEKEVNQKKRLTPRVYYPPPILVYSPAGEGVKGWPDLGHFQDPDQELDDINYFAGKIENCIENHNTCGKPGGEILPTRLLDIGTGDGDVVKLVESDKLGGGGRKYATVSHRWCQDRSEMFMTLLDNVKDRYQGIDVEEMPQVLRDAIQVTRALGLQYLWMDNVCLIQDDYDNKEKEMLKMGDYYANAHFAIAASSSANSTKSFLETRNGYYAHQRFSFGRDAAVHVRLSGVEGHLSKRGWTWQESALSVRILNFAPSELVWECREKVESECGYELQGFPSLGLAIQYQDVEKPPLALWQDLVQSYSARYLGYFNDCLPAISGLAKKVHERTRSTYFAGIWEEELVPSLLWEATRDPMEPLPKVPHPIHPDTKKLMKCKTPSWSWASIQGWVRTSDARMGNSAKHAGSIGRGGPMNANRSFAAIEPDIRNPKVSVTFKGGNRFGEVTGGCIELYGRIISVRLTCEMKVTTGMSYFVGLPGNPALRQPALCSRFSPDTELEMAEIAHGWEYLTTARRTNSIPTNDFQAIAHCLLIGKASDSQGRRDTHDGLVLGRSEKNPRQFTRIGFFSFSDSSWFDGVNYDHVVIV